MGGKRQNYMPKSNKPKLTEKEISRLEEAKKAKEKQSLAIRICTAAVILIAALLICFLILKYDFNASRSEFIGTYVAERAYIYGENPQTSGVHEAFIVSFYEDGRMLFKYKTNNGIHYYTFKESRTDSYDGILSQYTDGKPDNTMYVVKQSGGDLVMRYQADSVSFSVPDLVRCFGEEMTKSMMSALYDEDICSLIIAGDYDSITDKQLKEMGIEREKLLELEFSINDLPVILTLDKISDKIYSREDAWNLIGGEEQYLSNVPSFAPDIASDSDIVGDEQTDA